MIRVLEPGAHTTVQDLGRPGQLRYGIPPSGPVDRPSFIIANRLVANADSAAGLECTLIGPRLRAEGPCAVAVTGADMAVTVNGAAAPSWTTLLLLRISPANTTPKPQQLNALSRPACWRLSGGMTRTRAPIWT